MVYLLVYSLIACQFLENVIRQNWKPSKWCKTKRLESGFRTSREYLFEQTKWMTVNQIVYYHTALCTFRIRISQEPEILSEIMNRDNDRTKKIVKPNTTLTIALNSYCFRGSLQWNQLCEEIRSTINLRKFRTQLKTCILSNVAQFDAWWKSF